MNNKSEELLKKTHLVFYGSNLHLITEDYEEAVEEKDKMQKEYKALKWEVGNIEDFGNASWKEALEN